MSGCFLQLCFAETSCRLSQTLLYRSFCMETSFQKAAVKTTIPNRLKDLLRVALNDLQLFKT